MKQMGCRWDAESRSWYHSDPVVGQEARRLVQEARELKLNKPAIDPSLAAEVEHGM
jgi:hypothetical protein